MFEQSSHFEVSPFQLPVWVGFVVGNSNCSDGVGWCVWLESIILLRKWNCLCSPKTSAPKCQPLSEPRAAFTFGSMLNLKTHFTWQTNKSTSCIWLLADYSRFLMGNQLLQSQIWNRKWLPLFILLQCSLIHSLKIVLYDFNSALNQFNKAP